MRFAAVADETQEPQQQPYGFRQMLSDIGGSLAQVPRAAMADVQQAWQHPLRAVGDIAAAGAEFAGPALQRYLAPGARSGVFRMEAPPGQVGTQADINQLLAGWRAFPERARQALARSQGVVRARVDPQLVERGKVGELRRGFGEGAVGGGTLSVAPEAALARRFGTPPGAGVGGVVHEGMHALDPDWAASYGKSLAAHPAAQEMIAELNSMGYTAAQHPSELWANLIGTPASFEMQRARDVAFENPEFRKLVLAALERIGGGVSAPGVSP